MNAAPKSSSSFASFASSSSSRDAFASCSRASSSREDARVAGIDPRQRRPTTRSRVGRPRLRARRVRARARADWRGGKEGGGMDGAAWRGSGAFYTLVPIRPRRRGERRSLRTLRETRRRSESGRIARGVGMAKGGRGRRRDHAGRAGERTGEEEEEEEGGDDDVESRCALRPSTSFFFIPPAGATSATRARGEEKGGGRTRVAAKVVVGAIVADRIMAANGVRVCPRAVAWSDRREIALVAVQTPQLDARTVGSDWDPSHHRSTGDAWRPVISDGSKQRPVQSFKIRSCHWSRKAGSPGAGARRAPERAVDTLARGVRGVACEGA